MLIRSAKDIGLQRSQMAYRISEAQACITA